MDRKVYITGKVDLVLRIDEGVNLEDILDNMRLTSDDTDDSFDIEDSSVGDWEVTDSK